MPYYIYLDLRHVFTGNIRLFWESLKKKVESGQLPDFASLQYPPHVTISGSFEMDEKELGQLMADIKKFFSFPFSSSIDEQKMRKSRDICCYDFVWNELSFRVKQLQNLYPHLPWVTFGYHMTLLHGPQTNDVNTVMKKALPLLPEFPRLEKDFDVVVWKHAPVPNASYSWTSRTWEPVLRVQLSSL